LLRIDYRVDDLVTWPRPTELQLAELAAQLARAEAIDAKQLVNEAWSIYWASCQKIQEDYLELKNKLLIMEAAENNILPEEVSLPQPAKFPITFQKVELLLLPKFKGRTDERAILFREYLFAGMIGWNCVGLSKETGPTYWNCPAAVLAEMRTKSAGEVARVFGLHREATYDAQSYSTFGAKFLRWYGEWSRIRKSDVKARNARKGWERRRREKTTKTGARPNLVVLRQALTAPPPP
jgi:hypothetical protein